MSMQVLQDELPHAGTLQKASKPLRKWNHDNVGTRSWQIEGEQHPDTANASNSPPNNNLLLKHAAHGSTGKESPIDWAGNDSTASLEAEDATRKGDKVQGYTVEKGGESKSQQSDETDFMCMEHAATSKFRALVDPTEAMQTSIEQLSSEHLDAGPWKPSVAATPGTRLARLPKDSSSFAEAMCSSQHDSNSEGGSLGHDVDAMRTGVGSPGGGGTEGTSTCNSTNEGGMRGKTLGTGLLGESGQAIKAIHESLKELEDVHSSDELMHFEFFGPFWELSEV
jgi:hypothetical protein